MTPSKRPSNLVRAALFLAVLLSFLGVRPAQAQVTPSPLEPKDPGKATLFSVFAPGSGHLYAGERGTGLFLLAGSGAALVGGLMLSDFERDYDYTCSSGNCIDPDAYNPNYTPLLVGAGVAGALWLYGVIDAPRAARRTNRDHGLRASVDVAPVPVVRNGSVAPGFAMRVTF
jgi:hypothetical protein